MCSQLFYRLINREARRIGGDFKKDAARFVEVDRVEVITILYRCHVATLIEQELPPVVLLFVVCCTPGIVMNCPYSDSATWLIGLMQDIDTSTGTTIANLV